MTNKKYNLNEIRIEEKTYAETKEILDECKIWNVHWKLETQQGYTYKNVLEIVGTYERIFVHLDSDSVLLKICDNNEILNKVIGDDG